MKKWFTYADVRLDRTNVYTPCYTVYIPNLYGKAEIIDEQIGLFSTPKSILNLGYVNVIDETIITEIDDIFSRPNMHFMKQVTNDEAREILLLNDYIEVEHGKFLILEETVGINGEVIPAQYLTIN